MARGCVVLGSMLAAAAAAAALTPRTLLAHDEVRLEQLVPQRFEGWVAEPDAVMQIQPALRGAGDAASAARATYDDVLLRTYRRADGRRVMLALAYGRQQTQEIKIHRPELCYYAQGFEVRALGTRAVQLSAAKSIESRMLLARNRARIEVVTYWIRIGDQVADNAWRTRWILLREGLNGRIPDGLLMRVSSLAAAESQTGQELSLQRVFLADLYRGVPANTQKLLAGS